MMLLCIVILTSITRPTPVVTILRMRQRDDINMDMTTESVTDIINRAIAMASSHHGFNLK